MLATPTALKASLRFPYTAIVVGGGVTGVTTACLLRRSGISCHVLEKAPSASHLSGLHFLGPTAIAKLETQFSLGKRIINEFQPVQNVQVFDHKLNRVRGVHLSRLLSQFGSDASGRDNPFSQVWAIPSASLRRVIEEEYLSSRTASSREEDEQVTQWGETVVGHRQVESGVEVMLDDGTKQLADFVIGADGPQSVIARTMTHGVSLEPTGIISVSGCLPKKVIPAVVQLNSGDVSLYVKHGVTLALYWGESLDVHWTLLYQDESTSQVNTPSTEHHRFIGHGHRAIVRNKLKDWNVALLEILELTPEVDWNWKAFHVPTFRNTWADERAFLVGQAACAPYPGTFLSDSNLDDAFWCASALRLNNFHPSRAADAYVDHRIAITSQVRPLMLKVNDLLLHRKRNIASPGLPKSVSGVPWLAELLCASDPLFQAFELFTKIWNLSETETVTSRGHVHPSRYERLNQPQRFPQPKDDSSPSASLPPRRFKQNLK